MRSLIVTLAVAASLVCANTAAAATPREILSDLAAHQVHSWIDNSVPFPELVAKYKAGERLSITCFYVSEVGRRLLVEAGYRARIAETVTWGTFDGLNDGHAMLEVFDNGRWQLYDVDANARAVDQAGLGVSLVDQVAAVQQGRALWEPIADDPLLRDDEPDQHLLELARAIFADPAGFYLRVMGSPLLPRDPAGTVNRGMFFHDADHAERMSAFGALASDSEWAALTTTSTTPVTSTPAPAPPRITPAAPAPATASSPQPTTVVAARARPACSLWERAISRRRVTCRTARTVLRRYVRHRHVKRWRCRTRSTGTAVCRRGGRRVTLAP